MKLKHKFVEFIPKELEDNLIYISIRFSTAVHKCACGCGTKTVTPFSPTDWKLIFDGKSISLDPSIGNWGFLCQSHYWINKNNIEWTTKWSKEMIEEGRKMNKMNKKIYYQENIQDSSRKNNNSNKPWWKFKWLV